METNASFPSLGVVAISYNEEGDLPGFLEHLLPWVDEIVVVDDGSTDRTAELAKAAGRKVRFIDSPRREGEYYADQRNKGIAAAVSDWLLHMDIDERVPPILAREILDVIGRSDRDAYRYRRRNYFLNRPMKGGGWSDWNQVHLARRNVLRFTGMFHENCEIDAGPGRIGQLREKMFHLNDDTYAERLRKSAEYQEEVISKVRRAEGRIGAGRICWAFTREFFVKYLAKGGLRDGVPGLIWALHAAVAAFRVRALVWDEQNRIPREDVEAEVTDLWRSQEGEF